MTFCKLEGGYQKKGKWRQPDARWEKKRKKEQNKQEKKIAFLFQGLTRDTIFYTEKGKRLSGQGRDAISQVKKESVTSNPERAPKGRGPGSTLMVVRAESTELAS